MMNHIFQAYVLLDCGVAYELCPKLRVWRVRTSPSEAYPTGKLQWGFTYSFVFRHSLRLPFVAAFAVLKWLLIVPVGAVVPFWSGDSSVQTVGELVGCVKGREVGSCARLVFRDLSCCEASVTLSLWLRL